MRPWRLTRRARVEMEAALGALRRDVTESGPGAAWLPEVLDGAHALTCAVTVEVESVDERILRARVALALRGALRADEDARCEEARARIGAAYPYASEVADVVEGTDTGVDAMREWLPLGRRWLRDSEDPDAMVVPRALWEVAR